MDTNIPILLVDDEEGIRNVLGIALADMGYQVYTAENGERAIDVIREIQPPIVLTDIKMPGMGGIDLLCIIKKEFPDIEVIMITGHGDLDLAIKSLKFEATDFITKPILDDALEIALKRAHERILMRRQLKFYTEGLEDLVREKSAKLLDAERMAAIGQTVAGLSHTIKNLAGSLKGGAFVLEKGIEHEDLGYLKQGWTMIRSGVDKIAGLSMNLLNYAKTSEINCRHCHPNQPVEEVIELMAFRAKEENIQIEFLPAGDLQSFDFDPEGMHQCLLNLITNAFDALRTIKDGRNEKIVTIRTIKRKDWGVEYQVEDNGCGMEPETLNKIFRSFFTTKGTGGTGIGLMMTKNIIDKHQGEIQVSSKKGVGSTFIIRLPKAAANGY
ncbi:MAG: response regulator [Desulfobacterales bacterium]